MTLFYHLKFRFIKLDLMLILFFSRSFRFIRLQFFVLIFVIEAILKLLALGVVRYFKDKWNTFDFIVTVLGAVELFLEGVQGLSVFRSFRLVSFKFKLQIQSLQQKKKFFFLLLNIKQLRPLRLGRNVPAFDLLLTRMQHIFSAVSGQTIIFFMAIYIFVVFGCHQFGPDFKNFKFGMYYSFLFTDYL